MRLCGAHLQHVLNERSCIKKTGSNLACIMSESYLTYDLASAMRLPLSYLFFQPHWFTKFDYICA